MERILLKRQSSRPRAGSDVVLANGFAYVGGLTPIDLDNERAPIPEHVEDQVKKIFANLERILGEVNLSKADLVSVRISLVDLPRLYDRMTAAYRECIDADHLPARSCIGISHLPHGALVLMEFIAQAKP
jgi:2-iminobutanoate/2-iminopropanoate deaminase